MESLHGYCENCEQRAIIHNDYHCSICYTDFCETCFFEQVYTEDMCYSCFDAFEKLDQEFENVKIKY
jgi:hypothetical protein